MTHSIKLAEDTISQTEINSLAEWLVTGKQLTKGSLTLELEKAFAEYIGSKHAVYVNSGSSANLLMAYSLLESSQLRNKIAIVPSVSWVTSVSPFMQLGFETHLCDCDINDLGLDLDHFEYLCKKHRPSIALIVHVLGHAGKVDAIKSICQKYDVVLIEDSCESLGSTYHNGQQLGTLSTAGSYSFYYGHHISTIEGGMVVCDDTELYNVMLSIRSHGWSRDTDEQYRLALQTKYGIDDFRNLYTFYHPGFNLRSTDLQAYLGLSQLKKLPLINKARETNFETYSKNLPEFYRQRSDTAQVSSFAYGTLIENPQETYNHLKKFNIESRPLICGNIGRHPFWTNKYGLCELTNADIIHDYGIYLPNHANLFIDDINRVSDIFKQVAKPFQV